MSKKKPRLPGSNFRKRGANVGKSGQDVPHFYPFAPSCYPLPFRFVEPACLITGPREPSALLSGFIRLALSAAD